MERGRASAARLRHAARGRVQALLGRAGWEIRPLTGEADDRRGALRASERIDLVLDVGANVGQYAMRLRNNGYGGRIESFEPYRAAFRQLERTTSSDPLWRAHRVALSDTAGEAELNVASNSFSSSLLPVSAQHVESAPGAHRVDTERVPTARLDALWEELVGHATTWLKLDVQGAELAVLRGLGERAPSVRVIETELSLVALYEGGADWRAVVDWLADRGFALAGVEPGFEDARTGRLLQFDGTFIRG